MSYHLLHIFSFQLKHRLPVLASLHERFTTMLANGQVNSHRFYTVRALLLHLSEGCCLLYFIRKQLITLPPYFCL